VALKSVDRVGKTGARNTLKGEMKPMSTPSSIMEQRKPCTPHDLEHSPVVLYQMKKRADDWQLHLADRITAFAGSMAFVWVHLAIFAVWVSTGFFGKDRYPFQFLTFLVSLEAIFLSTFVMIGQNRSGAFQQAKADHDFHTAETELAENTDLTRVIHNLSEEIRTLVKEVRQVVVEKSAGTDNPLNTASS
jgi:uncharacterized membrane protein